jgi:GYF domain 2
MADQFYVGRGNRRSGPFSAARLRELAAAGWFRAGDTVWREGMASPVLAVKVKNLFPAAPPPADPAGSAAPVLGQASSLPAVGEARLPAAALAHPEASVPSGGQGALPGPDAAGPSPPAPSPQHRTEDAAAPGIPVAKGPPARPPEPARKRRAVALKGAVVLSQDGHSVQYRKKCTQCGHEDTCRSTMLIGHGVTRTHFFCPRCRKSQQVQLQGMMQ